MRNFIFAVLVLAASVDTAQADSDANAQIFSQDEAALISALRHVLADVDAIKRNADALQIENEKLKGGTPKSAKPQ